MKKASASPQAKLFNSYLKAIQASDDMLQQAAALKR